MHTNRLADPYQLLLEELTRHYHQLLRLESALQRPLTEYERRFLLNMGFERCPGGVTLESYIQECIEFIEALNLDYQRDTREDIQQWRESLEIASCD